MSKIDYNQHLVKARNSIQDNNDLFLKVEGQQVTFSIQSGPTGENGRGRNGLDATEIIRFAIGLYRSFNNSNSCRENSCTITKLEEALHWQEARTRDRNNRGVEGTSLE